MKKITKIFASVFALLLVCVGAIGLVGCKDKENNPTAPNNIAYGQEFTVSTSVIDWCGGYDVEYGWAKINVDFRVTILNTTNQEYYLNNELLVLSWDDDKFTTLGGQTYLQYIDGS